MLGDKLLCGYHDVETISNDEEPDLMSKAKVASTLESRSSFRDDGPAAESIAARCRYKTGRCTNARVVKPNGTLLLLCEFHRSQQNRTKKRSDMKYRQDRAKKRLVERQQATKSRDPAKPQTNTTSGGISEEKSMEPAHASTSKTNRRHRRTCQESPRSPGRPEKLKSLGNLFQYSECEFFSEVTSPADKLHHDRSFFYSSSSVRDSKHYKHHHYHPFRTTTIHSSELHIDLEYSDTEATDSATTEPIASGVDVTSSVFPLCMSPLDSVLRWREVVHWQPDDVQLLEYFIL
uniref:Uncharacterized protein n=1 Tax=Globisporangium ultimum (strain ATCC 200006 / CBS 805.95 / DAOM BR144) TaxID=431595 RepID=K3W8K7_GLOUD